MTDNTAPDTPPSTPNRPRRGVRAWLLWVLKNTLNRATTRMARAGHGPFSLVRHAGRRSGRRYETPVLLASVPEGFIAELTYGDRVDWYRNVIAASGCVVVHHGREYRVSQIEPCGAERGRAAYPASARLFLKATKRTQFRLLRTDNPGSTTRDA